MTKEIPYAQLSRVEFHRFKAFRHFSLSLKHFNILVGPNNAGKSTILTAFRILAAAMRRANSRKPEVVPGPAGPSRGYPVDLKDISVAEENIFYNYIDEEPATVKFHLSTKNILILFFPTQGECYLIADAKKPVTSPSSFLANFHCPIGFVPILGPVDHDEPLFDKEAARRALFNYRAARNFRNIWYHYPENFDDFRLLLNRTWPGMDIDRPVIDRSDVRPYLHMFCPEERIPREIFWAGFGFQVWCQMLTHIIQSKDASIFLIDEPDIYLHADLQRQLLGILRNIGPDILIATHSVEIITEAEPDEIVVINKKKNSGSRINDLSQLRDVFNQLGSNLNPILTQLAKTRRVLFVEGKDFQILSRFASRLNFPNVASRADFAVVPVEGFNPERIRNLKAGMEATLGGKIRAAAVFDRDFRSKDESDFISSECKKFCDRVYIHDRKEIENFLLVPSAIDRAATRRIADHAKRGGGGGKYDLDSIELLLEYADKEKPYLMSQHVTARKQFERKNSPGVSETTVGENALREFEVAWATPATRLTLVGGKDALSSLNEKLQESHKISITPTAIIDAMPLDDIPPSMRELIQGISDFCNLTAD